MLAIFNHLEEDKNKAAAGTCAGSSAASSLLCELGCSAWLATGKRKALLS